MTPFIYVTEMNDPVNRWKTILDHIMAGDPIVVYTKAPAPLEVLTLKQKNFAIGYTITGWGGTWMEPHVPAPDVLIKSFNGSAQMLGDRIYLRVDPVVPTAEGYERALSVIKQISKPVKIITSILQLYKCHEKIAARLGITNDMYPVQSGRAKYVSQNTAQAWMDVLVKSVPWTAGRVQMCGMPYSIRGSVHTGCVDDALLKAIGVTSYAKIDPGKQRPGCKCVISKKQVGMGSCPHHCVYCYAHKENLIYCE